MGVTVMAKRFIYNYWLPLFLGMTITAILVLTMAAKRGGFEIGSEFLVTPALLTAHYLLRDHYKRKRRRRKCHTTTIYVLNSKIRAIR